MPGTTVATMNTTMMDTPMTAMIWMIITKQILIPILELPKNIQRMFKRKSLTATDTMSPPAVSREAEMHRKQAARSNSITS